MVNAIPIPIHLLIHSVEYHEKEESTRYSSGYKQPTTIKNVRFSPTSKVINAGSNEIKTLKAKLYIDCINSNPVMKLKEQSKVVFNNETYIVQFVKEAYATELHHYRVELI
ncbi:MAG TPA: putative minor capsid protein [Rummeliibacillus sp.]|nr:putative minor capsid protein [Rummeliibacillus sp.]